MKKKVFRIMILTLILIFTLKAFPISSLVEEAKSIDVMGLHAKSNLHKDNQNYKDWIHSQAIRNRLSDFRKHYYFGMISEKMIAYLPKVISEIGELRHSLRDRIDRNKEMLAHYNIHVEKEAILLTSTGSKEITELREDISIVVDVFDDDIVDQKKKTFLEAYQPSVIANLIEGNCIGLRSPPAFKGAIHLV
ncbi:hypothetical protein SAMN05446037_101031 [Anaerovirgula multivorans]|uniref:Uncharacterized protein n=1 Tax=Anaerovirgula multivorans TaxID=312168 RepID=A0A239EIR7_9FIRM|nr:hypothetical protein [Anaerovirgula multivorans]SNS43923.1 hypothetical protein SAMN05446037_101031 [Anaerovirgula multivorans]